MPGFLNKSSKLTFVAIQKDAETNWFWVFCSADSQFLKPNEKLGNRDPNYSAYDPNVLGACAFEELAFPVYHQLLIDENGAFYFTLSMQFNKTMLSDVS